MTIKEPGDLEALVRSVRCSLPYRVQGAELVMVPRDAKCSD